MKEFCDAKGMVRLGHGRGTGSIPIGCVPPKRNIPVAQAGPEEGSELTCLAGGSHGASRHARGAKGLFRVDPGGSSISSPRSLHWAVDGTPPPPF
jgi:hypothetical protein